MDWPSQLLNSLIVSSISKLDMAQNKDISVDKWIAFNLIKKLQTSHRHSAITPPAVQQHWNQAAVKSHYFTKGILETGQSCSVSPGVIFSPGPVGDRGLWWCYLAALVLGSKLLRLIAFLSLLNNCVHGATVLTALLLRKQSCWRNVTVRMEWDIGVS